MNKITTQLYQLFALLWVISLCFFVSGCMDLASNDTKNKKVALNKNLRKGQVYSMRGGLGGIFSTGMNQLENTLRDKYQIRTSSTIWYKVDTLSDYIAEQYSHGLNGPIILVGHSLGANDQIKVAQRLARKNIPVALLITVDAVAPLRVPANVKEVLNIYKPGYVPMFSGIKIKADDPKKTKVANMNVNDWEVHVNHFTIDKHDAVQKLMIERVLATLAPVNKYYKS